MVPGAQPRAARWAGRMTSPGRGGERTRGSRRALLRTRRSARSRLGPAAAAMTQGPGGRAAPRPPQPQNRRRPPPSAALLPRMPQWKFAAPAGFLSRGPAAAQAAGARGPPTRTRAGQPCRRPALAAAVLGACEPRCAAPCPLPALSRCRGRRGAGTAGRAGGDRAPGCLRRRLDPQRQLHPQASARLATPGRQVLGPGVSYVVRVSASAGPWDRVLPEPPSGRGGSHPPLLSWTLWTGKPGVCPSLLSLSPRPQLPRRALLATPIQEALGVRFPRRHVGRGAGRGAAGGRGRMRRLGVAPHFLGETGDGKGAGGGGRVPRSPLENSL